jgi:hypothetical protein
MQILNHFGIGLGAIITAVVLIAILYAILEQICKVIVRKFDMHVKLYSSFQARYSELTEDQRLDVQYINVVLEMIIPIVLGVAFTAVACTLVGAVISTGFGL